MILAYKLSVLFLFWECPFCEPRFDLTAGLPSVFDS
jgi:hypothetical protein